MANGFSNGFFDDPIDSFIKKYQTKVYEPAVRQYQRDNPQAFDNQYDLRAAGGGAPADPAGAGLPSPERVRGHAQLADFIYGSPDPLSEAERTRMSELTDRSARLQPLELGVFGSSRIPGNPFSIDTRGLLTGLGDLTEGIVNRERARRRGEFEDELAGLQTRQEANQQIAQNRQEFLREFLPEEFTRAAEQAGNISRDRFKQQGQQDLERLRQQGRLDLENLKNSHEKLLKGDGDGMPASWPNSVARLSSQTSTSLLNQADAIDEHLRDVINRNMPEEQRQALMAERDKKRDLGYRFMSVGSEAFRADDLGSVVGDYQDLVEELRQMSSGDTQSEESDNRIPEGSFEQPGLGEAPTSSTYVDTKQPDTDSLRQSTQIDYSRFFE